MNQVNIHEAKTNFSRLISAIKSGAETEIIIAQNGVPAARLVPIEAEQKKTRQFGFAKDRFDFDYDTFQALDVEVQKLFDDEQERNRQNGW